MKLCPLLNKPCIGTECSWYFQELSQNDLKPVMNMQGCSMQMTAQYLMEIRPFVFDVKQIATDVSSFFQEDL